MNTINTTNTNETRPVNANAAQADKHAHGLAALLERWQPLADDFPEIDDEGCAAEDIF